MKEDNQPYVRGLQPVNANLVAGWDMGGAHLKLATLDRSGSVLRAEQFATPLWEGVCRLEALLDTLRPDFDATAVRHVLTMTGELVDVFADRRQGVRGLMEVFQKRFGDDEVLVYAGPHGLVTPARSIDMLDRIASANWHATARMVGGKIRNGILADMGSTTFDVVPVINGEPCCRGYTDQERMQSDELLFSGVVRTPVMAIVDRVPFRGEWQSVAAEHFATAADVHRITGRLAAHDDMMEPADHGGKEVRDSVRRLARMLGLDAGADAPMHEWIQLAAYIAERQLDRMEQACRRVISGVGAAEALPLIGAGCGRFLIRRLAARLDTDYIDFNDLLDCQPVPPVYAAECAAAVAVASAGLKDMRA